MWNIRIYILLFVITIGGSLNAQLQLGLHGGVNMANTENAKSSSFNLGSDFGILAGVKVLKARKISIQGEYNYSKRGPKFVTDTVEYGMSNSYHIGTILGKYSFNLYKKIDGHILVGGYLSYWTYSKVNYEYSGVGVMHSNKIREDDPVTLVADYTFNWNSINYGISFGGGLSYKVDKFNSFFADLRYEKDISEFGKYKRNAVENSKRMSVYAITFKVGYIYTFGSWKLLHEMFAPKR